VNIDYRCLKQAIAAAAALLVLAACHPSEGGSTAITPTGLPSEGLIARVPLSDFAGIASTTLGSTVANPYEGQQQAIAEGKNLYVKLNCAGCHLYNGKGSMGPDLTDSYWRYGGTPANIYKSIFEGRPHGMPAWGRALPPEDIWKIVSYIESLGGSIKPDQYQAALQGDRPNEQIAPEVAAAAKAEETTAPGIAEALKASSSSTTAPAQASDTQATETSGANHAQGKQ